MRWPADHQHKMNPKLRARNAVKMALRSGRLIAGPCVFADRCSGPVQAHHEDYAQPLTIWWVCKRHHDDMTWRGVTLPEHAAPAEVAPSHQGRRYPLTHQHAAELPEPPRQKRLRSYWMNKELRVSEGAGARTRDLGIKRPLTATAANSTDTEPPRNTAPDPQQDAGPQRGHSAPGSPTNSPHGEAA